VGQVGRRRLPGLARALTQPVAAHQKLLLLPFGLGVEGLEPRRFFAAQRFFHQAAELLPEAEDIGLYLARSVDDWERVEKGALPGQAGKLIIVHMVGRRSLFEFICEFQDYVTYSPELCVFSKAGPSITWSEWRCWLKQTCLQDAPQAHSPLDRP
jgi:hypothetical protein